MFSKHLYFIYIMNADFLPIPQKYFMFREQRRINKSNFVSSWGRSCTTEYLTAHNLISIKPARNWPSIPVAVCCVLSAAQLKNIQLLCAILILVISRSWGQMQLLTQLFPRLFINNSWRVSGKSQRRAR